MAPYKDRKAGLVIFGVLTILGGCLCALSAFMAALTPFILAHSPNPPPVRPSPWFAMLINSALAALFIWLGIGSIMARRWARTLLAVLSWSFLVFGVGGLAVFAVMAPQLKQAMAAAAPPNQPAMSDAAQNGVLFGMLCFFGFLMVLGPLVWALFYSGRNVKATCEAQDPVIRWTDAAPPAVLGISLWLLFAAVSLFTMASAYPAAPFFGVLLSGIVARLYYLGSGCIWIYGAWALYRLDRRGWWTIFLVMIAGAVSSIITFTRHDMSEVYRQMHYPEQQMALIRNIGFQGRRMLWFTVVAVTPMLGYLLYVRKYMRPSTNAMTTPLQENARNR